MRRTDEEFKQEVWRRSERYNKARKKRLHVMAMSCVPMVLCGVIFAAGLSGSFRGKDSTETAIEAPRSAEGAADECCDCAQSVILEIEITTAPGGEVWNIEDPDEMQAVLDGIQAFYDDPQTVRGDSDVGQAEGMSYTLTVTENGKSCEYTLFHDSLLVEDGWLVNEACYRTLEALICKEQ